jgi:drug/metabolite transporter (DMT)-like permease
LQALDCGIRISEFEFRFSGLFHRFFPTRFHAKDSSPGGTAEHTIHTGSAAPSGLFAFLRSSPTVETVGYFRDIPPGRVRYPSGTNPVGPFRIAQNSQRVANRAFSSPTFNRAQRRPAAPRLRFLSRQAGGEQVCSRALQMHLFLPFFSSILYVVAALFMKQAAGQGVGVFRITFLCNWITALLFLVLWPMGGAIPEGRPYWQPALVALTFVAGQICTFLALERGDVSVATPVMGVKVVLVAGFTTLIMREQLSLQLWAAAGLSSLGIAFLNRPGGTSRAHAGWTIGYAMLAATCYALFDVLVMKWSPAWGAGRFLPIMLMMAGVLSLAFIPMFRQPLRAIPRPGWRPVLLGGVFMGLQALLLITTLGVFGDATAVNVIYSTRGLWSVFGVMWVGAWFSNTERELGWEVLGWRLVGAAFLSGAVLLVFV